MPEWQRGEVYQRATGAHRRDSFFDSHSRVNSLGLTLIGNDQPRAAVASMDAQFGNQPRLLARRTVERVHIASVRIIPGIIFHQDFDADLSLPHSGIIKDEG
jgi:hypothetical protein